jgi:hypothetical protein
MSFQSFRGLSHENALLIEERPRASRGTVLPLQALKWALSDIGWTSNASQCTTIAPDWRGPTRMVNPIHHGPVLRNLMHVQQNRRDVQQNPRDAQQTLVGLQTSRPASSTADNARTISLDVRATDVPGCKAPSSRRSRNSRGFATSSRERPIGQIGRPIFFWCAPTLFRTSSTSLTPRKAPSVHRTTSRQHPTRRRWSVECSPVDENNGARIAGSTIAGPDAPTV